MSAATTGRQETEPISRLTTMVLGPIDKNSRITIESDKRLHLTLCGQVRIAFRAHSWKRLYQVAERRQSLNSGTSCPSAPRHAQCPSQGLPLPNRPIKS